MFHSFISALAATAASTEAMSFKDRASTAGLLSLEGMLVIFCALTILWIAIEVMHFALHHKKKKATAAQEAPKQTVAAQTVAPAPVPKTNDDALIAVITAAIAASLAEEGYTGGFRVVSFKRADKKTKNRF